MASVTIDEVAKGTVDLYTASPGALSKPYTGLSNAVHTLVISEPRRTDMRSRTRQLPPGGVPPAPPSTASDRGGRPT